MYYLFIIICTYIVAVINSYSQEKYALAYWFFMGEKSEKSVNIKLCKPNLRDTNNLMTSKKKYMSIFIVYEKKWEFCHFCIVYCVNQI